MFRRYFYRSYRQAFGLRYWFGRRFARGGRFAVVCLALATGLGADTNQTMAYQVCAFLTVLLIVAAMWTVCVPFRAAGWTVRRRLPRFGTAGRPVMYGVSVTQTGTEARRGLTLIEDLEDPRPTWAEYSAKRAYRPFNFVEWLDDVIGYTRWWNLLLRRRTAIIEDQTLPDVLPRGEAVARIEFTPTRRGRVQFRSVTMARSDVFGLVRRLWRLEAPQSLLILPKRYWLPPFAVPGARAYQRGGVALAASVGQSDEFVSLRDYRPGDPWRHIHWKSVAKADRLIVREHEDEFFVRHALILDTFAGPERDAAFEEAVSVAASFVCAMQTQESLLDLLFIGPEAYCFTAGRGVGHVDRLLEVLAGVGLCADGKFSALEGLVTRHTAAVSGCVCVFLAWDEPRQRLVKLLRALRVPVRVCVVTDADEKAILDAGPMRDEPEGFHQLRVGKIQEALARLG